MASLLHHIIATKLAIRLVEIVGITNYDENDKRLPKPDIFKTPIESLPGEANRDVIVVDEVSESGNTTRARQKIMPYATYAIIHIKPEGKDCTDYYVE
jgi:hypoxanthine phosphoribosyltransferase